VGLAVAICLTAVVCAFALAARAAQERGASPGAILVFFVAAFVAAPWGVQARTQALALPLFSVVLWLVLRDQRAERRSTLFVLPVLCLWANLHGSGVLGAMAVSAYGILAIVRHGWRWRPAALALLAPATLLASPYALELPGYYRMMLFNPPFGHEIVEWQRTTPSNMTALFFALVVASALLLLLRRRRATLLDCLLLGLTVATALSAIRLLPWFALTALAVMPSLATPRPGSARYSGTAASIVALGAGLAVLVTAGLVSTRSYDASTDAEAAAVIREQAGDGYVLADLSKADWILWKIPSLRGRVAYDGRPELLTHRQFQSVLTFERQKPGWPAVARSYRVVVTDAATARSMTRTGRWKRVYGDPMRVVLRRR
jgi:MFS family permease